MDGLAIAASLNEMREALEGAVIRGIYAPTRSIFVFHAFRGEKARLAVSPREAAIHLTSLDLPNPPTPAPFVMLLRKHIKNARIERIEQAGWDRVVRLAIVRDRGRETLRYELIAELIGLRGSLILLLDGTVLGASRRDARYRVGSAYAPLASQMKLDATGVAAGDVDRDAVARLLDGPDPVRAVVRAIDGIGRQTAQDLLAKLGSPDDDYERQRRFRAELGNILAAIEAPSAHVDRDARRVAFYTLPPPAAPTATFGAALDQLVAAPSAAHEQWPLRTHLLRALGKRARTADKLRAWLDSAADADRLQAMADLLMIQHGDVPPKAREASLVDPTTEETVTVRLDPSMTAIENARSFYERAKRLRRGRPHVERRLRRMEREIEVLDASVKAVDGGREPEPDALRLIEPRRTPIDRGTAMAPVSGPFRRFEVAGYAIWVGRSAAENDLLLRRASPDDVWMHARDVPGSHVIVRRSGRGPLPDEVLLRAARLAAGHSKAGDERRVAVAVAAVKNVRKPRGAPAGLVNVSNADTLTVEPMKGDE